MWLAESVNKWVGGWPWVEHWSSLFGTNLWNRNFSWSGKFYVDIDNLFINISLDRYLSTDIGCRVWWANLLHSIQAITLVQWYVPEGHKVVTKTKSMSRDSHKTNTSLSDSLTQLSRVYQVSPIQPAVIAFTQAHLLQQALLQLSGFSLEIKK